MTTPLQSYLRTYRKRSGFSQDELAFLLGSASGGKVSRYERLARNPSLRTAFAYEVIFRTPVKYLFAGLYEKVERLTLIRVRQLAKKLADAKVRCVSTRKLAVLESLSSGSAGSQDRR